MPEVFNSYDEVEKTLELAYSQIPGAKYVSSKIRGGKNSMFIRLTGEIDLMRLASLVMFRALDAMVGIEQVLQLVKGDKGEGNIKIDVILGFSAERTLIKSLVDKLREIRARRAEEVEKEWREKGRKEMDIREEISRIKGEHLLSFMTNDMFVEIKDKISCVWREGDRN